ncbi:MAG: DUF1013 domain-containing protein [Alphaproteobacteria bacterium]|nr:DUF1013 domain-containing protein [Alphaproteobacteria bacterium]
MSILMPKATAVWLIDNTALTFVQISGFVGLHELEVTALADGDTVVQVQPENPLQSGLLTQDEIDRCSGDTAAQLQVASGYSVPSAAPKGGRRYTPMLKRANKPNAVAWLVREYPEMTDDQVNRLVGSTKPTIQAIRNRSHWNMANIEPGSPVELSLCTLNVLQAEVDIALAQREAKDGQEAEATEDEGGIS